MTSAALLAAAPALAAGLGRGAAPPPAASEPRALWREAAQPSTPWTEPDRPEVGDEPAPPDIGDEPAPPHIGEEPSLPGVREETMPETPDRPASPGLEDPPVSPETRRPRGDGGS